MRRALRLRIHKCLFGTYQVPHTLSLSPTLRTRHTHSTALFLAQLPRGPNLSSEGLPPPLPALPCPLPDPDEGPPRPTGTFPVTPPLRAGPASQPSTRHPPTWFAHVTRHCAVGPTAQDASDWPAPFPASGLRSKQHCLSSGPAKRERPLVFALSRGGAQPSELAPGRGSPRRPSGAAKSRIEPRRPEYDRSSAGWPEAEPSAAGRSRARPKGLCARGVGRARPQPWRPRGQMWPEAGLLEAAWPRTACGRLCAPTRPRTGGAARRGRETPSAEPTSGAGSTWAGPGAEYGRRS